MLAAKARMSYQSHSFLASLVGERIEMMSPGSSSCMRVGLW